MLNIVISLVILKAIFGFSIFWFVLSRKNRTIDTLKTDLYLAKRAAKENWRTIMHYERIMNENNMQYGPPKGDK